MKKIKTLLLLTILFACDKKDDAIPAEYTGEFLGQQVQVGNGKANVFVVLDKNKPVSMGIRLDKDALQNLPTAHHTTFLLPMPAVSGDIPFKHITLDWESHGHDPEGIYDLPHFDMHFYMITNNQRLAIGADDPKLEIVPEAKYIPEGYFPTPGFPQMGKHWLDGSSPEWHGETFTYTFIYGSYDGKISFYEPMITRDFLLTNPDMAVDIRQPQSFAQSGQYPKKFAIRYDSGSETYTIALENFEFRPSE